MLGVALAVGMVVSGSFNTISNELMDRVVSRGTSNPATFWSKEEGSESLDAQFNHPFVQALFMMFGEATCMLVFLIRNHLDRRQTGTGWTNQHGWKATFCYAATASCDVTATSLMYAGLALTSASVYQMLRGAIIVFTALLTVTWLKRRLFAFQWVSVAVVVVGVCIVGLQSIMGQQGSGGVSQAGMVLGVVLILSAQCVQAVQVVAQEKLINKFGTPPLRLVGLEGIFGSIMLSLFLIPMYYIKISGYPIENAPDAWVQITNSPSELPTRPDWHIPVGNALAVAIGGNVMSIAFFNFFGICITKVLSGSHRMVLDSMRTCAIWAVSLILGWETFHPIQLVGFLIMLLGTSLYNEYIRLPCLFTYPSRSEPEVEPVVARRPTLRALGDSHKVPLKDAEGDAEVGSRVNVAGA